MRIGLLAAATLAIGATTATAEVRTVTDAEKAAWVRWVIPLPKQIAIAEKVVLEAEEVAVTVREGGSDVEENAAALIRALWEEKTGARPEGAGFEILLGVCDDAGRLGQESVPGASELKGLKNPDQAYVIRPLGEQRLVVAGLTERAVLHGASTLRWLLEPAFEDGKVEVPLATVTDWPDLSERGEWGGSANSSIPRFVDEKMNLVESHCSLTVTDEGEGVGSIDPAFVEQGRLNAVKVVPILTHLDQLQGTRIYDVFPELKGIGDKSVGLGGRVVAPCASKPKFTEILGDWLASLASMEGVDTVCCWLSEHHVQCGCDDCQKVGQYALEAQSLVRGWEHAKQQHPDMKLRILLTQGSYTTNEQVIAATPPEVQISYYDGGRTYDSSRDEMIYPLLEEYTASGRWLGCYPQLTASWRIVCPWSGPQFIRYRMQEFVEDGLECLCGYATPHNALYDFNVCAAAEWSWNSSGRDEREFAAAWATRRGLQDPDAAADWAVTLGPVGWDVYGSRVPYSAFFGEAGRMVADRRAPGLGAGMFRYFPTVEHFTKDLAICEDALAIAEGLEAPTLIAETKAVRGYVTMLQELYAIALAHSQEELPDDEGRQALQDSVTRLAQAALDTNTALQAWEVSASDGGHFGSSRFADTLDVNTKTVGAVATALKPLGITDPSAAFRRRVVGQWVSDDFEAEERIEKTWEVTDLLDGPGEYEVRFQYTSGWNGLVMFRAALLTGENEDDLRELALDEHQGTAAYKSVGNQYALPVEEHEEGLRYLLRAEIRGVRSSDKREDRRGCNGEVTIRKLRDESVPLESPEVGPISEALQGRYGPPRFDGDGVAVGVVQGGYGSVSVLESLGGVEGLEAQAVGQLLPEWVTECGVLVLPQPHQVESFTAKHVALLEGFVRDGGGLVATHNAVGYRGFPLLLTSVCAQGLAHVRDTQWRVAAEHPITTGIDPDAAHEHGYYDHIELEPGPDGVVVAEAAESGRPVVVCGEAGKGRYVAFGLLPGVGRSSDNEEPLDGPELRLLVNAVKWAAGG